jgi:hypothetical protein
MYVRELQCGVLQLGPLIQQREGGVCGACACACKDKGVRRATFHHAEALKQTTPT